MGFKMPFMVGYEDYGPNKNNWMKNMSLNNWLNRMDIYGTHYYPHLRPLSNLKSDLTYAGSNIPFWSTEPHWDNKSEVDDWTEAEEAICALWDQVDAGMTAFMWWGYARTGTLRGNLMREFSVPLKDARVIDMNDFDGRGYNTYGKFQTHAFRENNTITVYAVNNNAKKVGNNHIFMLSTGKIIGNVNALQWIKSDTVTGTLGTATQIGDNQFSFSIPPFSLSKFTFTYAESSTENTSTMANKNVSISPTIATNSLRINGLDADVCYKIYDSAKRVQISGKAEFVDIDHLASGVYFLETSQGQVLKFIKQ